METSLKGKTHQTCVNVCGRVCTVLRAFKLKVMRSIELEKDMNAKSAYEMKV